MPRGVGWPPVFGSTLLMLAGVRLFTGILSLYDSPSPQAAYLSVQLIETQVIVAGRLARGIHYWAAGAFALLLALHLLRTFLYAAYNIKSHGRPRGWWV